MAEVVNADADAALLSLLMVLRERGYDFVTPTPASHARVLARSSRRKARSLVDILGWSLPFAPELIDTELHDLLARAAALEPAEAGCLRSLIRISSLMGNLYVHSAYPTNGRDAVFFGPDSYRFARMIRAELARHPAPRNANIVDIGTGAGVGAIVAARQSHVGTVTGTDVNPLALRLAAVNARAAKVSLVPVLTDELNGIPGEIDLALANPPYIIDESGPQYRDGGRMHGAELSLRMARAAVPRLAPGGRLLLYTGSAIVDGWDALRAALTELAAESGCALRYGELDPDVFGEELERDAYRDVDRIAVVEAVLERRR